MERRIERNENGTSIWDMAGKALGTVGDVANMASQFGGINLTKSGYDADAVNLEYVSAVLAPEEFHSRQPTQFSQASALATSKMVFTVETNATGDVGVYIFPNQPIFFDASLNMAGGFISLLTNNFDPTLGTVNVPDIVAGPLTTLSGAILQYKCTAFSVEFLPTISSLNNEGEVHCLYWNKPINTSADTTNVIAIPLGQMPTFTGGVY